MMMRGVSLFFLVLVIGGLTVSSASPARDRGASRAAKQAHTILGTVSIQLLVGYGEGRDVNAPLRGRFTISGAITDRGTFLDKHGAGGPLMYTRVLVGAKGKIRMAGQQWGPWRLVGGTGSYAGLRGHSTRPVLGEFRYARLRMTMIGTVSNLTTG